MQIFWWKLFKVAGGPIAALLWLRIALNLKLYVDISSTSYLSNLCQTVFVDHYHAMQFVHACILWPQSLFLSLPFSVLTWWFGTRTILYSAFSAFIVRWFFFLRRKGSKLWGFCPCCGCCFLKTSHPQKKPHTLAAATAASSDCCLPVNRGV